MLRTERRGLTRTNRYALGDGTGRQRRPENCRSGAAKIADNTVLDSVQYGFQKQAPAAASPRRGDAFSSKPKAKTEAAATFPEDRELLELLVAAGTTARRAAKLVRTYPAAEVRKQLAWLPHRRNVTNPGAYLAEAIEKSWGPPAAALAEAKRRQQLETQRATAIAAEEQRSAKAAEHTEQELRADRVRAALSAAELQALEAEARAEADAKLPPRANRNGVIYENMVSGRVRQKLLALDETLKRQQLEQLGERARRDVAEQRTQIPVGVAAAYATKQQQHRGMTDRPRPQPP